MMKLIALTVLQLLIAFGSLPEKNTNEGIANHLSNQPSASNKSTQNLQIFELRNYELKEDKRQEFTNFFEEHFLEPQNAAGAFVLGYFKIKEDPNRFLWFRGFENMTLRGFALNSFYGGEIWNKYDSKHFK